MVSASTKTGEAGTASSDRVFKSLVIPMHLLLIIMSFYYAMIKITYVNKKTVH
jgi:hypothetical protein